MINVIVVTLFTVAALTGDSGRVSAARILAVFPHPGYSHHMVFLPYVRALADRGHDVHFVSNYPLSHANVTDVSIQGSMTKLENNNQFPVSRPFDFSGMWMDMFMLRDMAAITEGMFGVPAVRRLLSDKNATFDLVVAEHFNSELPLGFAAKYRAPFVLLNSGSIMPWTQPLVGQSPETAYRPSILSGMSERMDFVQRLANTLMDYACNAIFRAVHRPWSQHMLKKHLGVDVYLDEFASKASLVLVNSHWTIHGVSPTVPAIVQVGGMHLTALETLPEVSIHYLILINDQLDNFTYI